MPLEDTPPSLANASDFGTVILLRGSTVRGRYQIQAKDVVYMAIASRLEDDAPATVIWAWLQKFSNSLRSGNSMALSRLIELHSATVNPSYMYDGDPSPARATRDCNSIVQNGNRPYASVTVRASGQLPNLGAGHHDIPGRPNEGVWNRIMCTAGLGSRTAHDHEPESRRNQRRERIDIIRTILYGSSDSDKRRSWMGINAVARRAAWNIAQGRIGNPVPGFDDFAACNENLTTVDFSQNPGEFEQNIQRVSTLASSNRRRTRGRFLSTGGNCFVYRGTLRADELVYVEHENRDSRNSPVTVELVSAQHAGVTTQSAFSHSTGVSSPNINTSGQSVESTTAEGTYPTEERPATTSGEGTTTRDIVSVDIPDGDLIYRQLRAWSDGLADELTSSLGTGRRQ